MLRMGKKNFLRNKARIEAIINSKISNLHQSMYKMPTGNSFHKLKNPINDSKDENENENDSDSESNNSNKKIGYEAYKDPESLNSITSAKGNYSSSLAASRKLLEQNNNDNIENKNESTLLYTQPITENYTDIKNKEKRKSSRSDNKPEKVDNEKIEDIKDTNYTDANISNNQELENSEKKS